MECRIISENKHEISCNLPYEDEGEKQNEVFIKLLDVINEKNMGLENVHFFDEPSIFTALRYVENISNNLDKVDKDKIFGILKSQNNDKNYKYKVKVTLKFLINFSSIKDKDIIENSIFILLGDNYNKIRVLESLIDKYESHIINDEMIKMFLKSIIYESNNINVNNINKIINKICTFNQEEMDFIYENLYLVKNLIQKITYYNHSNINIIVDLIDNKFIRINKEIQYIIIDKTVEMKFSGEEHIKLYKKIVNNILTDSKNYNVVSYYLNKITEVKSLKSLEMLLDLYPFMSKHTKSSHNYIFNQLSDLDNLENIDYDDKTKRKKLIIPLNID